MASDRADEMIQALADLIERTDTKKWTPLDWAEYHADYAQARSEQLAPGGTHSAGPHAEAMSKVYASWAANSRMLAFKLGAAIQ